MLKMLVSMKLRLVSRYWSRFLLLLQQLLYNVVSSSMNMRKSGVLLTEMPSTPS
ncbi:unnamed protein product [Soboliphyme baturini]|uniref:Secreted protein n=1 Tax=Soboliphyme baturini TaxID=241478 RepID=A0A183I9E5_9BILA|nr:unnamed protein product [Soboliphyme baturini]